MANPMHDEDKIYATLRKEEAPVHPLVWEMLNHHIRNDLFAISLAIQILQFTPPWILKFASFIIRVFYKLSRQPGSPPDDLTTTCTLVLKRVTSIVELMEKLEDATSRNSKKYPKNT